MNHLKPWYFISKVKYCGYVWKSKCNVWGSRYCENAQVSIYSRYACDEYETKWIYIVDDFFFFFMKGTHINLMTKSILFIHVVKEWK